VKTPLGWLRDYIELSESTDHIVDRLAMLGFPVESVERRPRLHGIVTGRIVRLERHPNADRLHVATVDIATALPLTVVTAATNVAIGQTVPVATIGALLVREGEPFPIEPRTMRGIQSQGMLCSADELGFDAEWFEDGILQLDGDVPAGTDVVEHFHLCDDVLDIEITSNRVDAMSMVGIARELGAALGTPVRGAGAPHLVKTLSAREARADSLLVRIESDDCRRYVAQRFTNVHVRRSPAWIRFRLALAGQRPINNVVDIANFVMLELGQPQHAYDVKKLAGPALIARDAHDGERLVTLDGVERVLDRRALVIADETASQGLAGLRGAAASEVSEATDDIVVESASFFGPRIRRMGVQFGVRTDASARHERGLPLEFADLGAARAAELLAAEGAVPHSPLAVGLEPTPSPTIVCSESGMRSLIGIDVPGEAMLDALRALGFSAMPSPASNQMGEEFESELVVTPPYWRRDVAIPADVAEEIARIVGFDQIAAASFPVVEQSVSSEEFLHERAIAQTLSALGYREVLTLPLQPRSSYEHFLRAGVALAGEPLEIVNPLSEDQRFLRFSLVPALLELAAKYGDAAELRIFELGHVFERSAPHPFEIPMLAWLFVGERKAEPAWKDSGFLIFKGEAMALVRTISGRKADAVTTKAPALHPGKTASLIVDGHDVATIGAVDPRLLAAYEIQRPVYLGLARTADVPAYRIARYRAPSRYPSVERDLALVVAPDVPAHEIEHAIRAASDGFVKNVHVFDEYRGPQVGEDRKSLAVRLRFQRDDGTLTDGEVEARIATILSSLRERVGAHIRE